MPLFSFVWMILWESTHYSTLPKVCVTTQRDLFSLGEKKIYNFIKDLLESPTLPNSDGSTKKGNYIYNHYAKKELDHRAIRKGYLKNNGH